nr:IS3 family transposase [Citrobacter freundii]
MDKEIRAGLFHQQRAARLTGQIKQFWLESGCVYGYRKIHLDLRDSGQQCGINRVWRLMKRAGIKAQVGYRSPRARKGEVSIVTPNRLQRQFNPEAPDERWVTDITYIRTHEGWLYLAIVVDLFSHKVIGMVNATPDDKRYCSECTFDGRVAT